MLPPKDFKTLEKVFEEISNLGSLIHGKVSSMSVFRDVAMRNHSYKPEHFKIQEFVPKVLFDALGAKALWVMDSRIIWTADAIREYFNSPVIINNWHTNGQFSYRGFRPPDCGVGSKFSQHLYGRAIDFDVDGISAEEVRKEILTHRSDFAFQYITVIEDGTSWTHIDIRNTMQDEILLIKQAPA